MCVYINTRRICMYMVEDCSNEKMSFCGVAGICRFIEGSVLVLSGRLTASKSQRSVCLTEK